MGSVYARSTTIGKHCMAARHSCLPSTVLHIYQALTQRSPVEA